MMMPERVDVRSVDRSKLHPCRVSSESKTMLSRLEILTAIWMAILSSALDSPIREFV